jgi:hypothetical protein
VKVGTVLIWVGVVIVAVGVVVRFAPWLVSWFGRLPGDIRHSGETTTVFIPITSMLVVSIVASIALALIRRWGS